MIVTRRRLQLALGLLWLLDGALQAQPFMFTRGLATAVIAPAGQGQPPYVAGPVGWAGHLIASRPAAFNAIFVTVQLLLGLGLMVPRTARVSLVVSIVWALGVWYFGEGLGGIAGGGASLLTGAPGAALVYGILAAAAWPRTVGSNEPPAGSLLAAWPLVWIGVTALQLGSVSDTAGTIALGTLQIAIGLGALHTPTRALALTAGAICAAAYWAVGQDFGQLLSGHATDPNTGPLLVLQAVASYGASHGQLRGPSRRSSPVREQPRLSLHRPTLQRPRAL